MKLFFKPVGVIYTMRALFIDLSEFSATRLLAGGWREVIAGPVVSNSGGDFRSALNFVVGIQYTV